ncbi:hypothetical protein AzCIB_2520 [Azoarcus sp. CIB]|uniref:DUF3237 domain-containing protein n=1 Tax=Aromatoleum sp. (strain CIB) TaxID=198107 RepID=UPI00067C06FC|nr:DUF3237 domain-containing protein [Azoarcus sp. CIB]AKU12413.1 hypothetical protein AzCIB_2520 [Azoarcus sp. CIB]
MELEYVFSYSASVIDLQHVGGPFGKRRIARCGAGMINGPKLNGEVLEGAHDWILDGPDGWGRIDVRAQFRTHDGCVIYAQYLGVLEYNEKYSAAIREGGETAFEDIYFRSTPRFETDDPRYIWLTQSVFVGRGRILPGYAVCWEIYRVT